MVEPATVSILSSWAGIATLKWPRLAAAAFLIGIITGLRYFTDMLY